MRINVPLIDSQRKAMLPYKQSVGEIYRTVDWLRDSILNENRDEFDTALNDLRCQLDELEALVPCKSAGAGSASALPSATETLYSGKGVALVNDLEASERAENGRIFVVDDQEAIREIICSMLRSAGYECRAFAGGLETIASLESGEKCDLLITDLLNLPLDGYSLLEQVKQKFPKVVVIIASAIHDDSVTEACIRSGAYQYLREPFEREQLLGAVIGALEQRRIKMEHHE